MHSLSHNAYAHAVVNDRLRAVPPVRGHVAYAVARVAGRLDAEAARRAVA